MVEGGRLPGCGDVAGSALSAERATVRVGSAMAGGTTSGRAYKEFILMALCASEGCMFARQLEVRILVIECCRLPAINCVAL